MSQSSEVYLGLDRPCLGSVDCDPIVQHWDTDHLIFAANYWESHSYHEHFIRWAKLAREELQKRKVTKLLLQ